jgi:hypothetical protein
LEAHQIATLTRGMPREAAMKLARTLVPNYLDDKLIRETRRILNDLASVGIEPPYALLVSFVGVTGARFDFTRNVGDDWIDNHGDPLDRDQYHFDEAIFETVQGEVEIAGIVRPILDQMANAGGRATSPIFDAQGRYIPRRQ